MNGIEGNLTIHRQTNHISQLVD